MSGQIIITIGREYGSAGHEIGMELAKRFGYDFYDRNIIEEVAKEREVDVSDLEKYDEVPRKLLFSRSVLGYSNSPEEVVANMQFDYIRRKAESGNSFIIVGRCAEKVLKDFDGLISIFILGDTDEKAKRISRIRKVSENEAKAIMFRHDKKRKSYHNYYSPDDKWGDSRSYDITVNSSRLGVEKTVDILEEYIRQRINCK